MAGDIPREKIQEILDRVDMARVIGRHLQLKKQGARLVGLCPFHKEKSPSFSVDPQKKLYHCFGCHVGGDVIDFVRRIDALDFPDAVRALARETGVEIPEFEVSPEERRARQERERMFRANEIARDFFVAALWNDAPALAYLRHERHLSDETIRNWQLGWAPDGWTNLAEHMASKQVPDDLLVRLGLLGWRREGNGVYDKLRARIVFPIALPGGELAGFGARRADWVGSADEDRGPKYLNSPESPVYDKSNIFFGLDRARDTIRRTKRAVLVEGYLDVIGLHQAGVDLAVATCGTALSGRHAGALVRMVEEVVTLYDGDQAGLDATRRASEILLQAGLSVRVATVPQGEDPDTWVLKIGGDALEAEIDRAPSAVDAAVERAAARYRGAGVAGTVKAVEEVRPLLMAIKDPLRRSVFAEGAAKLLGLDPRTLTGHLGGQGTQPRGAARGPDSSTQRPQEPRESGRPAARGAPEALPSRVEAALLRHLVESPAPTIHKLEARRAFEALFHPAIRAALDAGRHAVALGITYDAHQALAVAEEEGGAGPAVLQFIRENLINPAPNDDPLDDCLENLLRKDKPRRLRVLRERIERSTDPEERSRLEGDLADLLTSARR